MARRFAAGKPADSYTDIVYHKPRGFVTCPDASKVQNFCLFAGRILAMWRGLYAP